MPRSMSFNYDDIKMVNLFPCAYSLMNMHFLLPAKSNYLFAIISADVAKLGFSWLSAKTWSPEEYMLCQIFPLASVLMSPLKKVLSAWGRILQLTFPKHWNIGRGSGIANSLSLSSVKCILKDMIQFEFLQGLLLVAFYTYMCIDTCMCLYSLTPLQLSCWEVFYSRKS